MASARINNDRYAVRKLATGLRPWRVFDDVTGNVVIEVADPEFARKYAARLNHASLIVRLVRRIRGTAIVREEWKERLDHVEQICRERRLAR